MRSHLRLASVLLALLTLPLSSSLAQREVQLDADVASADATVFYDACVSPIFLALCFPTIQAAVDAAGAGDAILIKNGVYFENVVIPAGKDDLRLFGEYKAILDPDDPNTGAGITILASGVEIRTLTIRNGRGDGIAVNVAATGTVLDHVTVIGSEGDCLDIDGNGSRIEFSNLLGCGFQAVDVDAHDVTISYNYMSRCGRGCVEVLGDGVHVYNNTFQVGDDGECVDIDGHDARVEYNVLSECASDGIDVAGHNAYVGHNTISTCDIEGIDVHGDMAVIKFNTIQACDSGGISVMGANPIVGFNAVNNISGDDGFGNGYDVDCSPCTGGNVSDNYAQGVADDCTGFDVFAAAPGGLRVERNWVKHAGDAGFALSGENITFTSNDAFENGGDTGEAGILVFGTNHVLSYCKSIGSHGDGVKLEGVGHQLKHSTVNDNLEDGIDVRGGGIAVSWTVAKRNAGIGVEVSAGSVDASVTKTTALDNRKDFCDLGVGTVTSSNFFGAVGACAVDD